MTWEIGADADRPSEPSVLHRARTRDTVGAQGYERFRGVLDAAYQQSAEGKGRVRHGHGKPFHEQPIMQIARMVGLGGHTYQICKKAQEATTMANGGNPDGAKAELLGIIVYAVAAYLLVEESERT
jgi:hypothetical protein